MYEDQTYEAILERTLERVATNVDKREGSVVMNAIAPVSAEHAFIYTLLDSINKNGYADTAIREYLIRRCKERGIVPEGATYATLKGKFNMTIPLGSRFNLDELNYRAVAFIENVDSFYYYQMECETTGTEGNKYFGELSSIEFIHRDLKGELVELLIPAEDEESTEALRKRYFNSFDRVSFGGNKQDYIEKVDAINGVGGTLPIPIWAGGGTVKLIIINSDYGIPTPTLVSTVQELVDPTPQGKGVGIAPIGHTVTVVSATPVYINVQAIFTLDDDYTWDQIKENANTVVDEYLLELRKAWEENEGTLIVRLAQIETRLLSLEGVIDIADTTLNGDESNITLSGGDIPILGGVTHG